jgi:hypothetical protein
LHAGFDLLASRWEALLKATRDDDVSWPSQRTMMWWMLGKRPQAVPEDEHLYELNRI